MAYRPPLGTLFTLFVLVTWTRDLEISFNAPVVYIWSRRISQAWTMRWGFI